MKKVTNKLLFSGLTILLILPFAVLLAIFGLGENKNAVKSTTLDEFDEIVNNSIYNIEYVQAQKSAIEISSKKGLQNTIKVEIINGVLEISTGEREIYDDEYSIKVYSPTCKSIINGHLGNIMCKSLQTSILSVRNEGFGSIDLSKLEISDLQVYNESLEYIVMENVNAKTIHIENAGIGNVIVSGNAAKADLINNGPGDIDISRLECKDVDSENNGAGEIKTL